MKIVFISSPLRDVFPHKVEENIRRAEGYCRMCYEKGNVPLAPHVYLPRFMKPGNKKDDAFATWFSEYWISRANELWCFDESGVTAGMRAELDYADKCGIPIRFWSRGDIA